MAGYVRPASPSGLWKVQLSRRFEDQEFTYKPAASGIFVGEDVLTAMEAQEGLLTNVAPA